MTVSTNPRRAFVDYEQHRAGAVRLRGETLTPIVASGLSAIAPSRKAIRTFVLAFALATGAFWAVMLKDPPTTVAAAPNTGEPFSPSALTIPARLDVISYDAH